MKSEAGQKTVELRRPSSERRIAPRVRVASGESVGRACLIAGSSITVGRHSTNDLVVDDRGVSGVHLRVARVDDRIVVRDERSTNGTWLKDVRLFEAEVAIGTELRIGETRLIFDTDDAPQPAANTHESFGMLVGRSAAMRELFTTLERIAPKEMSVLVSGDTGTGKSEVARAIHAKSGARATGFFVTLDATAIPEAVIERVLAERAEAAKGGTLLLDNVGEFSAVVQARLLRMLDDSATAHDVRIIAATARDLRHAIEAGTFREDLYFRLAQVRVGLPPLRDRLEDIPELVRVLLERIAPESTPTVDEDAVDWLRRQPWPGNVRELRNTLTAAASLAEGGRIRRRDVASGDPSHAAATGALDLVGTFTDAKDRAIAQFEAAYLGALMSRCAGNLSLASRESHLARHHLRDLLKKRNLYGLDWGAAPGDE